MEETYHSMVHQWERLQDAMGSAFSRPNDNSSSSDTATSNRSSTPSSSDRTDQSENGQTSSSNFWWWLSSLAFGLSSTVVYHWVLRQERMRRRRLVQPHRRLTSGGGGGGGTTRANDSYRDVHNAGNLSAMIAGYARQVTQWTRTQVRHVLLTNQNTPLATISGLADLVLPCALGASLLLPDDVTVPFVVGCLLLSHCLVGDGRLGSTTTSTSRSRIRALEVYPPYLFLCFCPGTHRFQLWFTWTSLQLLGHRPVLSTFTRPPKRDTTGKITSRSSSLPLEETTTGALTKTKDSSSKASSRYLEILVHNVSHTDLLLSLEPPQSLTDTKEESSSSDDPYCLCRPRFSFMDVYCRVVLDALSGNEQVVEFPRYQRSEDDPRYLIKDVPTGSAPAGLGLQPDPALLADLAEVRVRGRDLAKLDATNETSPWPPSPKERSVILKYPINYVFFPLLATLLPHWRAQIQDRQYPRSVKRVLILVTGVGTPRNWTHSVTGNSTEVCAQLMEHFLKRIDPDLSVVCIHSQTNLFRYDENLRFVDRELAPVMNAWRDAHARGLPYPDEAVSSVSSDNPFDPDWRSSMSVTLSATDGSTARTHAIRECLRPFRPTYFHFWQLKTFWHETKIVDDDLEVHSYETMETVPAVDTERLRDEHVQLVVDEMKAFREEMIQVLRQGQHDISKFWLRKTHKPVLAVLLVQSPGMARPVLYRGTNMEVSMPTGSLCAERNVIGTALASNPQLKREDLKLIAVLAIPTLDELNEKHLRRVDSSASMGTLESNPDKPGDGRMSIGSEQEEWILQKHPQGLDQSFDLVPPSSDDNPPAQQAQAETDSTPVRKIRLFSKSAGRHKHKRSVVVQNSRDLNPLRPCGACNEWLKKIAESNPYFKIVTFTDADCHGVYCAPCQE